MCAFVHVLGRRCEAGLRSSLLRQLQVLVHMLKKHMCPYLPAVVDLVSHCWMVSTPHALEYRTSGAVGLQPSAPSGCFAASLT